MQKACEDPENYKYALEDLPELTAAVQYRYRRRFGVELKSDEIMSVYGSQEGMAHIGLALCNPGDTILVPDPGYPLFAMSGVMAALRLKRIRSRKRTIICRIWMESRKKFCGGTNI